MPTASSSSLWPTRRCSGQRASTAEVSNAPTAGGATQQAQAPRTHMQDVFGKHWQQRGGTAQQHGKQVQ